MIKKQRGWWEWGLIPLPGILGLCLFGVNLQGHPPTVQEAIAWETAQQLQGSGFWQLWPMVGDHPQWWAPIFHHGVALLPSPRHGSLVAGLMTLPLLQIIAWELFRSGDRALDTVLVFLTLFPLFTQARSGEPAIGVLVGGLALVAIALKCQGNYRWSVALGLVGGALWLEAGGLALPWWMIALGFLWWDSPRLPESGRFWLGLALGLVPVGALVGWTLAQNHLPVSLWILQGFAPWRSPSPVEPWYYFKQGIWLFFPWLAVALAGLKWAGHHLHWRWGKLLLWWSGVGFFFPVVALGHNPHPSHLLPLAPVLALAIANQLQGWRWGLFSLHRHGAVDPLWWRWSLGWGGTLTLGAIAVAWCHPQDSAMVVLWAAFALTLTVAGVLMAQGDRQFILVLWWGLVVGLLLLALSPHGLLQWPQSPSTARFL